MIATVYALLRGAAGARKRRRRGEEEAGREVYVGGALVSTLDICKEIG